MVMCWDVLKPATWPSAVAILRKILVDGPCRLLLGLTLMVLVLLLALVLLIPLVLLIHRVLLQLLAECWESCHAAGCWYHVVMMIRWLVATHWGGMRCIAKVLPWVGK